MSKQNFGTTGKATRTQVSTACGESRPQLSGTGRHRCLPPMHRQPASHVIFLSNIIGSHLSLHVQLRAVGATIAQMEKSNVRSQPHAQRFLRAVCLVGPEAGTSVGTDCHSAKMVDNMHCHTFVKYYCKHRVVNWIVILCCERCPDKALATPRESHTYTSSHISWRVKVAIARGLVGNVASPVHR